LSELHERRRGEGVLDHPLAVDLQQPAAGDSDPHQAWRISAGSTPRLRAQEQRLLDAGPGCRDDDLVAGIVTLCTAPSRRSGDRSRHHCSSGRQASKRLLRPAHHDRSVRIRPRAGAVTGEVKALHDELGRAAEACRVTAGEMVLMSIHKDPAVARRAARARRKTTDSTSGRSAHGDAPSEFERRPPRPGCREPGRPRRRAVSLAAVRLWTGAG